MGDGLRGSRQPGEDRGKKEGSGAKATGPSHFT
jgi:hypothetical protein